jgi:transposase
MPTRFFGLDVHRQSTQVAKLENGQLTHLGAIPTTPEALREFANSLRRDDQIVLEATGNTYAIVRLLKQHVERVIVSNPLQTRAIADAKIKTDKIDAEVLVRLLAGGWLPEVWVPDEETQALRQRVSYRIRLVRHRIRLKNRVHGVLIRNLVPGCPRTDLFGKAGQTWLIKQVVPQLPLHEQEIVLATLRQVENVRAELTHAEETLARLALASPAVQRLITIPGVDAVTALTVVSVIGDIHRFRSPAKLVGYFGLDPRVRQSGSHAPYHGRITKRGRAYARTALVEAAWAAIKSPGPLRAFYTRLKARRGSQVAAVATARKILVLAWHLLTEDKDYAFARPSLLARKYRALELSAGQPQQRGQRGIAYEYNFKSVRQREIALCLQAERTYTQLTRNWQPRPPEKNAGASNGKATPRRRSAT